GRRLGDIHQLLQRTARPWHYHRPGIHSAMAIDALLERDFRQEIVDTDYEGLVDHAIDGDFPRPYAQFLGFRGNPLGPAEFIGVIVVDIISLIGDGAPGILKSGIVWRWI